MSDSEGTVEVTYTSDSFDAWLSEEYVDEKLRGDLRSANLLIVPIDKFRDVDRPVFPEGTLDLYQYLARNAPADLIPELCIADEDFNELALHFNLITLGQFVVTMVALPVAVNLLSGYLRDKLGRAFGSGRVRCDIVVTQDQSLAGNRKQSIKVTYDGPADSFDRSVMKTVQAALVDQALPEPSDGAENGDDDDAS